jgi:putative membrane protein
MYFLRTLFWIVITIVLVVFAVNNWTGVTINLWGGLQADAKLPVLLLIAFLLGALPVYAYQRAKRWRLTRRLESAERASLVPTPAVSAEPLTASPSPPVV